MTKSEWIPPTDEERKMFVDQACTLRTTGRCVPSCAEYHLSVEPTIFELPLILESLALDGADYDNMPEGFE